MMSRDEKRKYEKACEIIAILDSKARMVVALLDTMKTKDREKAVKELQSKPIEELERMYIDQVGLDKVIEAYDVVKKYEIKNGKKLFDHNYENTLQAMRAKRGKLICDQIASIQNEDEKKLFVMSLTDCAVEDAKNYKLMKETFENANEEVYPVLQ